MLDTYYELCRQLDDELTILNNDFPEILKKSEQSIKCITGYVARVKQSVLESDFSDSNEEIIFFKHIKPHVFHHLIYFTKVLSIESARPAGGTQFIVNFYRAELRKISLFYRENRDFCQYYRKGLTHFDSFYFVRGQVILGFLNDTSYFNADPSFSTTHDYKVACLLAYDKLAEYLQGEITSVMMQSTSAVAKELDLSQSLIWTDTKIALVELVYALHASGCFNNGRAGIKELATFFSQAFSVEMGDYYRNYLEIKSRQSHTKFLEHLRENLLKKIQQQEC